MIKHPNNYPIRFAGAYGRVAIDDDIWEIYENELVDKARAKLEAVMEMYCEEGPHFIPETRFGFEGRYLKSGKSIRREAFKTRQVRLYGAAAETFDDENESRVSHTTFIITAVDTAKKSMKAKSRILDIAGEKAFDLIHG